MGYIQKISLVDGPRVLASSSHRRTPSAHCLAHFFVDGSAGAVLCHGKNVPVPRGHRCVVAMIMCEGFHVSSAK
jgi:hypothetical protein